MSVAVAPRRRVKVLLMAVLCSILALALAVPAGAESGAVKVTAQNAGKLTISLANATSDFGSNLDPSGVASDQADVTAYSSGDNGAYYVKKGNANFAQTVQVNSNQPWTGSVQAAENSGTSGMKIASGSLRWARGNISDLAGAQGGTAFTTTPDGTVFGAGTQPKGINVYNYDYSLRVLWTDDPGTFSSIVTYSANQ